MDMRVQLSDMQITELPVKGSDNSCLQLSCLWSWTHKPALPRCYLHPDSWFPTFRRPSPGPFLLPFPLPSPKLPWHHTAGQSVTVCFRNQGMERGLLVLAGTCLIPWWGVGEMVGGTCSWRWGTVPCLVWESSQQALSWTWAAFFLHVLASGQLVHFTRRSPFICVAQGQKDIAVCFLWERRGSKFVVFCVVSLGLRAFGSQLSSLFVCNT